MAASAIQIKGLTKSFGQHKAIEDVSFSVKKGEIFGFLGPNGAGKTTTIRCMMNFLSPDAGEITVLGEDAQHESVSGKNTIGYVASDHHLVDRLTAREHIDYITKRRAAQSNYEELLRQFTLDLERNVKVISTGNR